MEHQSYKYDNYDRSRPAKVFVGEWATQTSSPTPNMAAALGDAAWMCGMERNADVVLMHCYAPLLVNINKLSGQDRSMQWRFNLIGYDALNSYGSPAYYAQKIFSLHHGDEVLATAAQNLPTYTWIQTGRTRNGVSQPARTNEVKSVFYSATRDTSSGKIIVKMVNRSDAAQEIRVKITGVGSIASDGTGMILKADNRDVTNSINDPYHVLPVPIKVTGLANDFIHTLPPCSITILELSAK
jgi:alpha-N-arabinofuranosidase